MKSLKLKMDRVEMEKGQIIEKWSGQKGVNLTFPKKEEGTIYLPEISNALQKSCKGNVCEVGCGPGRLASLFHKDKYIGVDINPKAIELAKKKNPGYQFRAVKWDEKYPEADTYLFFTVLIHIPDNELLSIFKRVSGRVVIGECMFRWIRQFGNGMNFQRDPDEYIDLIRDDFLDGGFKELLHIKYPFFPFFINIMTLEKH